MSCILPISVNNSFENLLEEVIAKACLKGAPIYAWYQSPNGRTVINFSGKLPIFYLSMYAAIDSLIHQYNLVSQYRYLYENRMVAHKPSSTDDTSAQDDKVSYLSKAIYEFDIILGNMDNELTLSTRRKVRSTVEHINASQQMSYAEFYNFQNSLVERYTQKTIEASSTKQKKQIQTFIRFLEEISYSDI